MLNIRILDDRCVGCYLCVETCPVDVFEFDKRRERPVVKAIQNCLVCRSCEFICRVHACLVEIPEFPMVPEDRVADFL